MEAEAIKLDVPKDGEVAMRAARGATSGQVRRGRHATLLLITDYSHDLLPTYLATTPPRATLPGYHPSTRHVAWLPPLHAPPLPGYHPSSATVTWLSPLQVAFVRHTTFRAGVLEYMIRDRDLVDEPLPYPEP